MADVEEQVEVVQEEVVVDAAPEAELDTTEALRQVLKKASIYDGLRRGLHE
jgi:hypothetical protein